MKKLLLTLLLLGKPVIAMEAADQPRAADSIAVDEEAIEGDLAELDEIEKTLPTTPVPAAIELPDFEQIAKMSGEELARYQVQLLAQEGDISPFIRAKIEARLKILRVNAEWQANQSNDSKEVAVPVIQINHTPLLKPQATCASDHGAKDQVPAPFEPGDFVDASDESLQATPTQIGKDSPRQPGQDLLARTPTPDSPEPKEQPSPGATPALEETSGDAQLAEKLTDQFRAEHQATAGGPAPQLPVQPMAAAPLAGSKIPAQESQGVRVPSHLLKEEETGSDAASKSDSEPDQGKECYSAAQKYLMAAAVVGAIYGTGEILYAYKTVPESEWIKNAGLLKKTKLVLTRSWENIKKRPSQGLDLLKRGTQVAAKKWQEIMGKKK